MTGITWIHLSDWHQESKKFDRKVVGEALIADIKNRKVISSELGEIDFIIFSGDAANTGQTEEYDNSFKELFRPLLIASGIDPKRLFIVPGNHDLDRGLIPAALSKLPVSYDQVECCWVEKDKRSQLFQPFQAFYQFLSKCTGHNQPQFADFDIMDIHGEKVAILGINSAWMCARNRGRGKKIIDQGYLYVGEPQIFEPLKLISNADLKIAVLHHPLDWLAPLDLSRVEVHLKRKCNIILHDHGHKPGVSEINDNFGYYTVIPAGACYDRRDALNSSYTFSYNFVHLDLDANKGIVFLRRWSEQNREWRKDDETCSDGRFYFSIFKNLIPHQIPLPPQDFTGREEDLRELLSYFDRGATMIVLGGMGGIGKTALAYKLAEKLKDRYPDGQVFVDLQGNSQKPLEPAEAMGQIIRSFDRTASLPKSKSELANLYRSTLDGKRALLLLDNAFDDNQVSPLQPPFMCGVLITSRRRFTLPGLREMDLGTLKPSDARDLLLAIDGRIGDQADELARLCGYLPLALKAAGSILANTKNLDPAVYIKELRAERTRLERNESEGVDIDVEASFGLNYARLPDDLKRVLRMASVFPADFDAEAEEAVCEDKGHRYLSDLVRWSLVDYLEATKEAGRYRLHDLIRVFATVHFNEEDNEKARFDAHRRHAEHYRHVLSSADKLYQKGREDVMAGLKLFDREWVNIQAGWAWAEGIALMANQSMPSDIRNEKKLALSLCISYLTDAGDYVLSLRLRPRDMIRCLNTALGAARQLKDRGSEGALLGNFGIAYKNLGRTRESLKCHEQSLAIARDVEDRQGEGNALSSLAMAYKNLGEYREALKLQEQALAIAREIGNRRGEGTALNRLGMVYKNLGEYQKARELHEMALAIAREIGNRRGEGTALNRLGIVFKNLAVPYRNKNPEEWQKALEKARELHEQALAIAKEIGDRRGEGAALCNIGSIHHSLGDDIKALELYEQHLAIAREIGDQRGEGAVLGYMGIAYYDLGNYRKAIEFQDQSLAIAREFGDRRREGNALWNKSLSLDRIGDRTQAIYYARLALEIRAQIESPYAEEVQLKLAEWQK